MKKYISKMFNLQGLLVDKVNCLDEEIKVHCRSPRIYCICPVCQSSTKKVHQYHQRQIRHDRLSEKQIILNLRIRRFKCKSCGKVFTEKIVGIDRKTVSFNFRAEVLSWLQRNSFRYISQRFKVSGSTLNRYVLAVSDCWLIDWHKIKVSKLGIDEHSFRGNNLVITITDISHHKLLAILKTDRQRALIEFLNSIPKDAKDSINEVCIDLCSSYKMVVKKLMPQADLVADRFHVEVLANRMVDSIRSVIQSEDGRSKSQIKKLLITKYYLLDDKEKIMYFYQINDYHKAKEQFKYITMLFETADHSCYLKTTGKTWKAWKNEILNYFKNKTTNGFTEGCHTKIKMMKRVSYGFRNIDNYIAKMMLSFLPLSILLNHLTSYHTS